MKNDNSPKKYRGFKYIMLALFFFVAVGLAFFSRGAFQTGDRKAEVKTTADSMVANVKQKGDHLVSKAKDLQEGMSDTMVKGREKVSEMASGIKNKADQMVDTVAESGTEWMDSAKSAVNEAGDAMVGAPQSNPVAVQASQMADNMTDGVSGTDGLMDKPPSIVSTVGEAMDESTPQFENAASPSPMISENMTGAESGAHGQSGIVSKVGEMTPEDSDAFGNSATTQAKSAMSDSSSSMASTKESDARQEKDRGTQSLGRCPSPPEKGMDLGSRYVVAYCETISIISERTGVGVNDIIEYNPQVENPDLIYPKQELRLPPRG